MNVRRFNWPLWLGFVLSVVGVFSYLAVFVWYPVTRDFPWANLLLFAVAAVLLFMGVRRAFASDRRRSKIVASIVATLGVVVIALFLLGFFVGGRQLPASKGAPQAGQKAPDFTLNDTGGKAVSLNELLSTPINGTPPKGVLLVFYRGYW
jgi:predicted PurR-regulated permease PerM